MKEKGIVTGIYGTLHFLVDFCCAFFIFRAFGRSENLYFIFLIYNFCAFALQMPAGLLADKWNRNCQVAAAGGFLTAVPGLLYFCYSGIFAGSAMAACVEMLSVVLTGIGNCLFHVGGGIEILNAGKDRLWPLGIFVSPGAAGIFFGGLLGKGETIPFMLPFIVLIMEIIFLLLWQKRVRGGYISENKPVRAGHEGFFDAAMAAALFCFFLVVVLRSHLGMIYSFPWKKEAVGGVLCLIFVMLGKAAGGIFADRFGIGRTGFLSLTAASLCFLSAGNMWFGIMGIFCFNMSMPLTLYLAARIFPDSRGFAFGILTFAIFIGFLPAYFGYYECTPFMPVICGLCSLLLLTAGYLIMRKRGWV